MSTAIIKNNDYIGLTKQNELLIKNRNHNVFAPELKLYQSTGIGNYSVYTYCEYTKGLLNRNFIEIVDSKLGETVTRLFEDNMSTVCGIYISNNKKELISIHIGKQSNQNTLRIWDIRKSLCIKKILINQMVLGTPLLVDEESSSVIFCSKKEVPSIYSLEKINYVNEKSITIVKDIENEIHGIGTSYDKKYIIFGDYGGAIKVLDLETLKIVNEFYSPNNNIWGLNTSDTDYITVSWDYHGNINVFDYLSGENIKNINLNKINNIKTTFQNSIRVNEVFISKNTDYILVVYNYNNIYKFELWNIKKDMCIRRLSNNKTNKLTKEFKKDLKKYEFSSNNIDRIYNLYYRTFIEYINSNRIQTDAVSYCEKTNRIAIGAHDKKFQDTISIIDLSSIQVFKTLYGNGNIIKDINLCNDKMAVSIYNGKIGKVNGWDIKNKIIERILIEPYQILKLANNDISTVLSGETDNPYVLDLHDEKRTDNYYGYYNREFDGINEKYMITLSGDKKSIYIINRKSKNIVKTLANFNAEIDYVYIAKNSKYILVKDCLCNIKKIYINYLYDKDNLTEMVINKNVDKIICSYDGRYLFTYNNSNVYMYDWYEKKQINRFILSNEIYVINDVILSKNLEFIIIVYGYEKYNIYDFVNPFSGELLTTLQLFNDRSFIWLTPPDSVAKSGWFYTNKPEHLNVYTENEDGTVNILENDDPIKLNYIDVFNRKDIIKSRLLKYKSYQKMIEFLKQNDKNYYKLVNLRSNLLL